MQTDIHMHSLFLNKKNRLKGERLNPDIRLLTPGSMPKDVELSERVPSVPFAPSRQPA